MPRTLNRPQPPPPPTPNGQAAAPDTSGEALTAATYPLQPLAPRRNLSTQEARREVDLMLQGDSSHDNDLAWYFYSRIPELRYIARYVANSLSQARLYVARTTSDPYNPERVGPRHQANQILDQFAGGFEGQSELLDRLGLHMTIAGDSVLAGPTDPNAKTLPPHPFNQWRVFSTSEIVSRNGKLFHRRLNGTRDEALPSNVTAFRIWRAHPRRWERADSPVLSSFTVLREIDLLDQHVHASAVSRLAGAGLLLLPDDITFPSDETDTEGEEVDSFVKHLTDVMSIAIKNRESAAATVPIMLRASAESINAIQHLTFSTPFDDKVPDLRNVALRRLALGMDVPPEVLLGMSESTQWSAWQTDESTVRLHTVPLLQLIANSLTVGWFRPLLRSMRLPANVANDIDNLTIWFDVSNLAVRPNKFENAEALYDRFEVGGDTLRITSSFSDSEKPTKSELETQVLYHLIRENSGLQAYAINALIDKGVLSLPEAPEIGVLESTDQPPSDTVDPQPTDGTPGRRSRDRQSEPPPTPDPNDPDPDNNEVGRP